MLFDPEFKVDATTLVLFAASASVPVLFAVDAVGLSSTELTEKTWLLIAVTVMLATSDSTSMK